VNLRVRLSAGNLLTDWGTVSFSGRTVLHGFQYGVIVGSDEWLVKRVVGRAWAGSIWLRVGRGGGYLECSNETSVFVKCGEFFD
jgi:hypothetical protein